MLLGRCSNYRSTALPYILAQIGKALVLMINNIPFHNYIEEASYANFFYLMYFFALAVL